MDHLFVMCSSCKCQMLSSSMCVYVRLVWCTTVQTCRFNWEAFVLRQKLFFSFAPSMLTKFCWNSLKIHPFDVRLCKNLRKNTLGEIEMKSKLHIELTWTNGRDGTSKKSWERNVCMEIQTKVVAAYMSCRHFAVCARTRSKSRNCVAFAVEHEKLSFGISNRFLLATNELINHKSCANATQ